MIGPHSSSVVSLYIYPKIVISEKSSTSCVQCYRPLNRLTLLTASCLCWILHHVCFGYCIVYILDTASCLFMLLRLVCFGYWILSDEVAASCLFRILHLVCFGFWIISALVGIPQRPFSSVWSEPWASTPPQEDLLTLGGVLDNPRNSLMREIPEAEMSEGAVEGLKSFFRSGEESCPYCIYACHPTMSAWASSSITHSHCQKIEQNQGKTTQKETLHDL